MFSKNSSSKRTWAPVVAGATAILLLGGVGGAVAAGPISSAQIKDHSVKAKDLKRNGVNSRAIKDRGVKAKDLAVGVLAGITGPAGATGTNGTNGKDGNTGAKGDTGATGASGLTGDQGPQGDVGSQGDQGVQGVQGDQGVQGEQGPQGDAGEQGPQGVAGVVGGNVGASTVMVSSTLTNTATATCPMSTFALGGGGRASLNRTVEGSFPSTAAGVPVTNGTTPSSWTVIFTGAGSQTAYVVCVGNAFVN